MKKRKIGLALLIGGLLVALAVVAGTASADSITVTADSLNYDGDFRWSNRVLDPCGQQVAMIWVNTADGGQRCMDGYGQGWTFKGVWGEGYGYYHGFGESAKAHACVKAVCISDAQPPTEYRDYDYVYCPRPTPVP